jgi:hypothetical protein
MTDMLPMQKLLDAAAKEYPSLTRDELTALIGLQIEARQDEIKNEMKRAKARITGKAKGGNIAKQMELFQDGGLKDEGGTKDPVSGNDVPPGATQEEVRDDIPAQLSEGEFVFPADVVRYIGLEKLMRMRQEAKMGLKMMEEMGQMGNADEATIPDDIPFSVIDIQIAEGDDDDDEVEKRAEGGVIEAANGFAGTTTATNPLQTRQSSMTASPTGLKTAYTAPIIPTATVAPTGGFKYKSPIEPTQKATFKGLFGGDELTQGPDEYRTYVNDSGAEIQIPFKNGKILTGFSVPQGFKPQTDDPRDTKIQTAKTKTARVERETGSDDGDSELGDLGGARTTIGGVEYAVQYNLDGTVGLQSLSDYRNTGQVNFKTATPDIADKVKTQTKGQIAQLAYMAQPQAKLAIELARKAGVKIPGRDKLDQLIKNANDATTELGNINISSMGLEDLTKEQMEQFSDRQDEFRVSEKDAKQLADDARKSQRIKDVVEKQKLAAQRRDIQQQMTQKERANIAAAKAKADARAAQLFAQAQQQASDDGGSDVGSGEQSVSDQASVADTQGGMFTAKGSLITRKKPKPKKMKRGGLASK